MIFADPLRFGRPRNRPAGEEAGNFAKIICRFSCLACSERGSYSASMVRAAGRSRPRADVLWPGAEAAARGRRWHESPLPRPCQEAGAARPGAVLHGKALRLRNAIKGSKRAAVSGPQHQFSPPVQPRNYGRTRGRNCGPASGFKTAVSGLPDRGGRCRGLCARQA